MRHRASAWRHSRVHLFMHVLDGLTMAGAVVAAVAQQLARLRQIGQECCGTLVVVGLADSQEQADQPALLVADRAQL